MRLLICTQKVAANDDVLGFMHRWIEAFAASCESVFVICLEEGRHHLPSNVEVFSLGKEQGTSRLTRVIRFVRYIVQKRGFYDAVFVHMNPEYMILGGLYWRFFHIPTALWYNHRMGGMRARIGVAFAKIIFYTSPFAYAGRFKKAQRMPAGIDTDQFKRDERKPRKAGSILSLGRISPVKQIEVIIDALRILAERGIHFTANLYGDPTGRDISYLGALRQKGASLVERGVLRWLPGIPNKRAAAVYNEHELFLSATPAGSFDKAVLEAMACEVPVISCNPSFRGLMPDALLFKEGDSRDLADKIEQVLARSKEDLEQLGQEMRSAVVRDQSLALLVPRVLTMLKTV